MKLIFLDIDGVLNTREDYIRSPEQSTFVDERRLFNQDMVVRLHNIVDSTGAKVVLSSSWRYIIKNAHNMEHDFTQEKLEKECIKLSLFGKTSTNTLINGVRPNSRWCYIKNFLEQFPPGTVTHFVILDDCIGPDMPKKHTVKTSFGIGGGLQDRHVTRAIEILGCTP